MCRSLHCAYLPAHRAPALSKGNPSGPGISCVRIHTAPITSMGMAWGGGAWRYAVPLLPAASTTGGWGSVVGG